MQEGEEDGGKEIEAPPPESVPKDEPSLEGGAIEAEEEELDELPEIGLLNDEAREVGYLITDKIIHLRTAPAGPIISEITVGEPFWLEGKFSIPVAGDGVTDYILNGDFVKQFLKIDASVIFSENTAMELLHGSEKIGTLYFDKTKDYVELKFDGTALEESAKNVTCEFGAMFTLDANGDWENDTERVVTIFEKEVTVNNPTNVVEKSINKSGKESTQFPGQVEWTVNVNATKNGSKVSLKDYYFEDNLNTVGEYVPGSFKVGTASLPDASVYNSTNKTLKYQFGDVLGTQTITFRTKIPEQMLVPGGSIDNRAYFGDDDHKVYKDARANISKKTIITKTGKADNPASGGTYDPNNQTITWTITVDPKGLDLTNVKVTDKLAASWTWQSAKWEWVGTAQSGITLPTITCEPTGGVYDLNNGMTALKEKVKLTIVSKVPAITHPGNVVSYLNSATITSDQVPSGQASGSVGVGIGITSLTKSGGAIDYENRQISWNVKVDLQKQNTFTQPQDLKVYDLLIYDKSFSASGSNLAALTGNEAIANGLTARLSQKYVAGSFANSVGLTMEVKTVMKNGQAVGDLLIVSGFTADMAYPYTFKTQVLDPNIFASNDSKRVQNTASLYYGTTKLMDSTGSVNYVSKVLSKEIMKADGSGVGDLGNGFNYEDRTAVFKLDINKDGFDLTGADIINGEMKKLGKITVVDTLPEGWSFVDLADGVTYELHKADGTLVTDVSGILAGEPVFGNGGRSATFTFSNLDTNYYILVKAQLSEEQYLAYGQINATSVTRTNNVSMTGEGDSSWNPTASQEVRVNTQFLDKQLLSPGDDSSALPKWSIYFHPYGLEALKDITVTDTLPEGLSLKLNQDGTLAEGAVVITEYNDPGNGTFPSTGGTLSTIKPTYDPITRKLTFKPAAGKLYKIEYETLVSGDIKGNVVLKNHVTVEGVEEFSKEVEKSWVVSSAWARGRVERIGMLQITKLGADQSPLAGAEFGLFNSLESETPISVGTSNASGIAYLRGIPAPTEEGEVWEYYLKETKAPSDDYLLDATIYKVSVSLVENSAGLLRPLVVVEGNQPNYEDGNKLTLINYTDEEVGDLTVKKTVENGEEGKEFKFIITINHTSVKGKTFATEGALSAITFDSEGKAEITLKDGESITIRNLPNDANYTVEEEDYSAEYKTQVAINEGETVDENAIDGTIVAEEEQTVNFTNSRRLGDLVLKKVAKYSEEANREFEFTITLDNEKLLGSEHTFAAEGKANSITFDAEGKANINLKDNEYLKILDLPHGTGYTITEADYSTGYKTEVVVGEGETLESNTATGEVAAEETQSVNYTNTRRLGNLLVFKTVELSEELDREFEFTITLDNEYLLGEEHTFAAEGKLDSITFDAEGKTVVNLMADEYIEIFDLPQGTGYTITEADYSVGYETKISYNEGEAFEGTIVTDEILAEETQGYNYINTRRLGDLMIRKTVELSEESDRAFEFTITLDNEYLLGEEHTYRAEGPDGLAEITFDAEGKAVISLLDGESLAIFGLPQGTGYTVTEADYSTGYKTDVIIGEEVIEDDNTTTGEILADQMPSIEFINTRRLGNLTVTKIVENSEESDRMFEFTITLDNEYLLDEEQTYPAEGVEGISEVTFDAEGKAVVNLKHGESLTIFNLPQGTGYTVTEADYSENYHTQVAANEEEALEDNTLTGEILAEQTQNVTFTNSRRLGDLTITKRVENSEESDREFEFNITLDNEYLLDEEQTYPAEGKLDSVTFDEEGKVTVTLKHGESLTILNLPQGTGYTVTEADYSESYITEVAVNEEEAFEDNSAMGEILAEDVQTVTFTNSRRLGDLTIHKTVKDSEEVNREFEFTITLHNDYLLGEEHAYAVEEREEPIVFDAEGKAVVTLKADERLTILSLPQGTGYMVTEADYSENYYTQVSVNTKEFLEENSVISVILAEALESVEFVNTRKLGDLTISKIVKNGNEKEAFEFTIELSNKTLKDTVYMASGKTDFVTFDKDAKATIKLAHGESVTIHNLPKGTEYTVTEADYSKNYTTKVAVNNGKQLAQYKVTGNITDEINQSVLYTNTGIDKATSSTTNKTSSVARTGDNSRNAIVVEMMIMLLALLVIVSTVVRRRNR